MTKFPPTLSTAKRRDAFARLFAKHQRWLYAYLMTLLANPVHAEEVFQEVCVVLWREYEKFDLNTDFVRWVSVIANHQVHRFRRQRRRAVTLMSEEALESLASETVDRVTFDLFEARQQALSRCLKKLPDRDRLLVRACYGSKNVTFKCAARELGRPVNTVYKALNRIRRTLHECIDRTLTSEGWS